jgi:hypothetical protein
MRPRWLASLTGVACAATGYVFFGRTRQLRWAPPIRSATWPYPAMS